MKIAALLIIVIIGSPLAKADCGDSEEPTVIHIEGIK